MAEPFSDVVAGHPNRTEKRLIFRHNAIPRNNFCTVSPFTRWPRKSGSGFSRGDRTRLELFLAGIRGWEGAAGALLTTTGDRQ